MNESLLTTDFFAVETSIRSVKPRWEPSSYLQTSTRNNVALDNLRVDFLSEMGALSLRPFGFFFALFRRWITSGVVIRFYIRKLGREVTLVMM